MYVNGLKIIEIIIMKSEDIYMKQQKTNWLEIKGCLPFNIICITVSDCKENWFQDTSKLTQDHRLPWHICQIDRSIKWYKWTFVLPWKVPMLPICKWIVWLSISPVKLLDWTILFFWIISHVLCLIFFQMAWSWEMLRVKLMDLQSKEATQ